MCASLCCAAAPYDAPVWEETGGAPGKTEAVTHGRKVGGPSQVRGCDPRASPSSAGDAVTVNGIRMNAGGMQTQEMRSGIRADTELTRTRER